MTMPVSEEQLAIELKQMATEIKGLTTTMAEFRQETRITLSNFVRADVYQAQQETAKAALQNEITTLRGEIQTLRTELTQLKGRLETSDNEKRQMKNILWGTLASAALAIALAVFKIR